jgi:hypothetical protein
MVKVVDLRPLLGCDPEFFLKLNGEVVGSETFIPKAGIKVGSGSKFIIDGVQAELNPIPDTCRVLLASEIARCFHTLKTEIAKKKGYSVDFSRTVEISAEKLKELTPESKVFGCAPSKNVYNIKSGIDITAIDPTKYRTRAAGGHIHIGISSNNDLTRALVTEHEKTVEILDIICGNTSVLIDRDMGNAERRKLYGKAGEFRQPKHGLEYRTLSNYWLTSYPLMSFAFGMARLAVQLMADNKNHDLFYKEFTSKVKQENIHQAINNNDFNLAMENYKAIEALLLEVCSEHGTHPIHKSNVKQFNHFVDMIDKNGLNYWFPQDPLEYWTTQPERLGFCDFLFRTVTPDMKKKAA